MLTVTIGTFLTWKKNLLSMATLKFNTIYSMLNQQVPGYVLGSQPASSAFFCIPSRLNLCTMTYAPIFHTLAVEDIFLKTYIPLVAD